MTEEKLHAICTKMVEKLAVAPEDPIPNLTPGQSLRRGEYENVPRAPLLSRLSQRRQPEETP